MYFFLPLLFSSYANLPFYFTFFLLSQSMFIISLVQHLEYCKNLQILLEFRQSIIFNLYVLDFIQAILNIFLLLTLSNYYFIYFWTYFSCPYFICSYFWFRVSMILILTLCLLSLSYIFILASYLICNVRSIFLFLIIHLINQSFLSLKFLLP